jgi:hypothetical protein
LHLKATRKEESYARLLLSSLDWKVDEAFNLQSDESVTIPTEATEQDIVFSDLEEELDAPPEWLFDSSPDPDEKQLYTGLSVDGFSLTKEQKEIVTYSKTGKDLKVMAFAGTGKTSTLREIANALPEKRGLYLAFNKGFFD